MKTFTHNNKTYSIRYWSNYGKERLYVDKVTGFKNRPLEGVGYWDLQSGSFSASRGYNHLIGEALEDAAMTAYKS